MSLQVASHQEEADSRGMASARDPFVTHFKGSKHNHSVVVHTLGPKQGYSNPFKAEVWTMELLGAFQKPCLTRMVQAPAFPCSGSYINQLKAPRKWPYHLKGVSSNAAQQYQNPKYLKAHTMFLFLVTLFWALDPIQPQSLAPRWSRRRRAPPAAPEGPAATGTPYSLFALSPQQRRDLIDWIRARLAARRSAMQESMPLGKACALLGLGEEPNLASVRAAYHRNTLRRHPDKGGSKEALAEVAAAYQPVCTAFD